MINGRSRSSRGITDIQVVLIVAIGIIASIALVSWFLISSLLAGSFIPGSGGRLEFEESETRSATLTGEEAIIEFSNFNGRVTLIPTSGNDLTVTITMVGRRSQIDNVDISFAASLDPGGRDTVSLFVTRRTNLVGRAAEVHLEALVPADISYDLDLSTLNGRIEVRQLHGSVLVARATLNGAIVLNDVEFDDIQAETLNGRVNGVIRAKEVKIETNNGAIDVIASGGGDYDLRTQNGAISVTLRESSGIRVDATTINGRVDWIGGPSGQSPGRLVAELQGIPETETITLLLRAANGNITIQILR